MYIHNTIL